ncbi:hypothetical protein ABTH74_19205, partial [Acinetobacter baumannii]
ATPASLARADAGARPGAIPIAPPVGGAAPRVIAQAPVAAKADEKPAADPKGADDKPATATAKPEGTPGNPIRWMPAHTAGTQNFALPDPSR